MEYWKYISDKRNHIHSIDNLICEYKLKETNMNQVAEELKQIIEKHKVDGYVQLNRKPCSKYLYYQNAYYVSGICYIAFGKLKKGKYEEYSVLPLLRLEVNPNKHYTKVVFQDILLWIKKKAEPGSLKRIDYAVDIEAKQKQIMFCSTKKEKGLFKGTIYRGHHGKHGFTKCYDKSREANIIGRNITRIETTLKVDQKPNFESVLVLSDITGEEGLENDSEKKLSAVNISIIALCQRLQISGIEYEDCIDKLDYRRKRKLVPYLYGNKSGEAYELEYPNDIRKQLLLEVQKNFFIKSFPFIRTDGFIEVFNSPFE